MDFLNPVKCKQIYGAPIGGIGTGSIGRTFSGNFLRYQLVPGIYEHELVEPNFFTVCIRRKGYSVYQQALVTRKSGLNGFKYWDMKYPGENATYHALYPEAWTIYNLPYKNVTLTCHQVSPVLPNNYKDSSLPVGSIKWTVENRTSEELEISLMFTWQSGSASSQFKLSDVYSEPFEHGNYGVHASGVCIKQKLNDMPLSYCIAAKKTVGFWVIYAMISFYQFFL